jgi:4-hydroxy-tetrahydrodipicolinate synthase
MMHQKKIFGLSAALVTPFDKDGGVDLARLAAHARHVLSNGCDSVTLFGTTGEGYGSGLSAGPAGAGRRCARLAVGAAILSQRRRG